MVFSNSQQPASGGPASTIMYDHIRLSGGNDVLYQLPNAVQEVTSARRSPWRCLLRTYLINCNFPALN